TLRYTLENRDPIETDPTLPSGGQIQITSNVVVHAQAFKDGLLPSRVSQLSIHCQVETPIFTPSSTNIAEPVYVSISSPTPGSQIRYYNAWSPSNTPVLYSGPILVQPETVLAVSAEKEGCDSSYATAEYHRPTCSIPTISPESCSVSAGTPLIL